VQLESREPEPTFFVFKQIKYEPLFSGKATKITYFTNLPDTEEKETLT